MGGRPWHLLTFLALLAPAATARAQFRDRADVDRLNNRLSGQVVDYTHNHGADRRIYSPILGLRRDLYVYLPPGYDPRRAYPLVLYLHMSYVDEHTFSGSRRIVELDRMICRGEFPPAIVAAPDGLIGGENRTTEPHSLFVNGRGGRFEDHLFQEVLPFVRSRYSIRPERQAHALLGASAGGFAALSLGIRHRDEFGVIATLAPAANLRYVTTEGYRADFSPATYRWREGYDPEEVVGRFYFGLSRSRTRKYMEPVFGSNPEVVAQRVREVNPADLLFSTGLQPGELAIYINYPAKDNWNFDAQAESFAWLAAQRGVCVDLERIPHAHHNLPYFVHNHVRAYRWLSGHLLGPTAPVGP